MENKNFDSKEFDRFLSEDCSKPNMVWITLPQNLYFRAVFWRFLGREDKVRKIVEKFYKLDEINPNLEITIGRDL